MWCVVLARERLPPFATRRAYPPRHAPLRDAQTLSNLGVLATLLGYKSHRALLELLRILWSRIIAPYIFSELGFNEADPTPDERLSSHPAFRFDLCFGLNEPPCTSR
jgi:hypothetical protein